MCVQSLIYTVPSCVPALSFNTLTECAGLTKLTGYVRYACKYILYIPIHIRIYLLVYISVSQPPGRGPVPGPGINYTGPREVLLEFVILVF